MKPSNKASKWFQRILKGGLKGTCSLRRFEGSFKGASRELQGGFKEPSKALQKGLKA